MALGGGRARLVARELEPRRPPAADRVEVDDGDDTAAVRVVLGEVGCAERAEGAHQEVAVRDRGADLERAVPGGEHREVVLVELRERLGVVDLELALRDLVDPGAHRLAEQLAPGLAADRVGDRADRVCRVYEAQSHR